MPLAPIDRLFWGASLLGHIVLLAVIVVRQRGRVFPVFTAFVTANIGRTLVLFSILQRGSKATYFYTYWSWAVVDALIQLMVIRELTAKVFLPRGSWVTGTPALISRWLAAIVVIAIMMTILAKPDTPEFAQMIIIKFNFFTSVLVSGFIVGIVVIASQNGLPLGTHVGKLALGLGTYTLAGVLIEAAHTYFGLKRGTAVYVLLSHMRIGLYVLCLLYWTIALWGEPRKTREDSADVVLNDLYVLAERTHSDLGRLRSRELQ